MIKIKKFKNYFAALGLVLAVFFATTPLSAAETFFAVKDSEILVGDEFATDFFLNTGNEDINTVEGRIIFPEKFLKLQEIKDGNSIINFWIERPQVSPGEVIFSGIIPGGYRGQRGLIFSAVFQAIQEGRSLIEIRDMKTLLADGKGTAASTTISNLQLDISKAVPAAPSAVVEQKDTVEPKDNDAPEAFAPIVTSDPAMFEGKYFLVFATADKGSGIDHYEVQEGSANWQLAINPYLLPNQDLTEIIRVKAIDKNGNVRIVSLPTRVNTWYNNYWLLVVSVLLLASAYLISRRLWRK